MTIDARLHRAAVDELLATFPDRPGRASAAYTETGRLLTGVEVHAVTPAAALCSETGPIVQAAQHGERLIALLSVAWSGPDDVPLVASPCGLCRERMVGVTDEQAEVGVSEPLAPAGLRVMLYRELIDPHPLLASVRVTHTRGLGPVATELAQIVGELARPAVTDTFGLAFWRALHSREAKARTDEPSLLRPSPFTRWKTLLNRLPRRVGWAFEEALDATVAELLDRMAPRLEGQLGLTEADRMHMSNGLQALPKVFANLLLVVEQDRPVPFEMPLRPFDNALLVHGEPLHEWLDRRLPSGFCGDGAAVLEEASRLLNPREPKGLRGYLRQRRLFEIPVFPDGPGWCPFSQTAEAVLAEVGPLLAEVAADPPD